MFLKILAIANMLISMAYFITGDDISRAIFHMTLVGVLLIAAKEE